MSDNVKINSLLPRVLPEEAGVSSEDILNFIESVKAKNFELHSFIMQRDGNVFAEGYYSPYTPSTLQTVYSLSKSFTSFAIGLAIDDGILKLTDKVIPFFPEIEYNKENGYMEQMTIKNLLTMSTGQEKEPPFGNNSAENFLKAAPDELPGKTFRYNTLATYMLSAILNKKGIDLESFLEERLFKHLDIEGIRWQRCPMGIAFGGFGLSLVPECAAKFGLLLLNKGVWKGKRIISESYITEATSKIIRNSDDESQPSDWAQGYGYQFWQCRYDSYRGDGMYGQFCVVSPDKKAVFSATSYCNDMQGILDIYYNTVLLKMQRDKLEVFKEKNQQLNEILPDLNVSRFKLKTFDFSQYIGKTYKAENKQAHESIQISFYEDSVCIKHDFPSNNSFEYNFETLPKTSYENYYMSNFNKTDIYTSCGICDDGTLCFNIGMLELLKFYQITFKIIDGKATITCYDVQPEKNNSIFEEIAYIL